jgi:small subunit ribosomal protein S6
MRRLLCSRELSNSTLPSHVRPDPTGSAERDLLSRRDRDRQVHRRWIPLMRNYELMVILDPDLEERTVAPSLDQYLNLVRQDGGSVESVDVWGRRRLAYEINKKPEGIYAVVTLSAEPATVKELDRQLGLNESVMRTKVLRPEVH